MVAAPDLFADPRSAFATAFEDGPPSPRTEIDDVEIIPVTNRVGWSSLLYWLDDQDEVCLDCEATDKDPYTARPLLCQLGDDRVSYVVVLPQMEKRGLDPLWKRLATKTIVGHNLNYDYRLLRTFYQIPKWRAVYDTQIAEAMLTAGDFEDKGHWLKDGLALRVLAKKYLGLELSKEVRSSFLDVTDFPNWEPTPEQLRYAALDTIVTMRVADIQVDSILREGLDTALNARLNAVVPIAEVELRGMRIDVDSWRAYLKELDDERREVEAQLISVLDPYEQRWRAKELGRLSEERATWETAREAEEARLREVWGQRIASLVTPSPTASSTAGTLPSPAATATAPRGTASPPTTVSGSTSGAAATGTTTAFGLTWGRFKQQGMAAWRSAHPNPGVPRVEDGPINLNSNDQLKRAYKAMGLVLPVERDKRTGKTREVCDAKARKDLLTSPSLSPEASKALTLHNRYSKLSKTLGSFGENILSRLSPQGRLHTNYNIGLTDTGRMSSENPNFQNFPASARLRNCFLADPGHVIITADFKSQELAIAAARSGDKRMAKELSEGRDLYKELAVDVFGLTSIDEVDEKQRKAAKSGLLGVSYGLTPLGMERIHGVPQALGERVIAAIRERYPQLFGYAETNAKAAVTQGYVTTALGAKRYFRDKTAPRWKTENEGKNAPIQGTAADIVYTMARRLEDHLVPKGIIPLNYVHDEAVVQVPDTWDRDEAVRLLVGEMQAAFEEVLPYDVYGVRCGVDCHVERFWHKG